MTPTAAALTAQAALIAARRAETITELRRHEAECMFCGEGPTDGKELRMVDASPFTLPEMICRPCFEQGPREADFTDLPLVWRAIEDASR
jgi:hypothetical protein